MKEVIYLRLEKALKQKLDQLAQQDDRSLNNFIIQILRNYVKNSPLEQDNNKKKD